MIDFPANPVVGQTFNSGTGPVYVWDGTVWNAGAMPNFSAITDTPPSNPQPGQMWWRPSTGQLYVYYDDGNSRQWVQAGGAAAAPGIWEPIHINNFQPGMPGGASLTGTGVIVKDLDTYIDLRFKWNAQSVGGVAGLVISLSSDNGATFFSGTQQVFGDLNIIQPSTTPGGGLSSQNYLVLGTQIGNTYASSGAFELSYFNKASTKSGSGHAMEHNGAANVLHAIGNMAYGVNAVACNALKYYANTGTINGRMVIEGIRG